MEAQGGLASPPEAFSPLCGEGPEEGLGDGSPGATGGVGVGVAGDGGIGESLPTDALVRELFLGVEYEDGTEEQLLCHQHVVNGRGGDLYGWERQGEVDARIFRDRTSSRSGQSFSRHSTSSADPRRSSAHSRKSVCFADDDNDEDGDEVEYDDNESKSSEGEGSGGGQREGDGRRVGGYPTLRMSIMPDPAYRQRKGTFHHHPQRPAARRVGDTNPPGDCLDSTHSLYLGPAVGLPYSGISTSAYASPAELSGSLEGAERGERKRGVRGERW